MLIGEEQRDLWPMGQFVGCRNKGKANDLGNLQVENMSNREKEIIKHTAFKNVIEDI